MGRPPRNIEVAQERRRRREGTLDRSAHMKLGVTDKVQKDNEGYALRWFNDQGNRLHYVTQQDDWDKVPGVDPVPVGTKEDGSPLMAHLCRKPKEFWEEDQAAKVRGTQEREREIFRKPEPNVQPAGDAAYAVPGNSVSTVFNP